MKKCIRFGLYLALFSFSFYSNAQHCTVVTWDKAQKQHEALEEWYNLSAVQFNELLFIIAAKVKRQYRRLRQAFFFKAVIDGF